MNSISTTNDDGGPVPAPSPAHGAHLPGLDLLRALAVVWTMLFHSFLVGGLGEDWAWAQRYGWMGVDLFFVLSGFLIGSQVLKPLAAGGRFSFREFYVRRAFRILPAFWAVLAVYLLWPGFREAPGMEPWWKFAGFFVNLSIDYAENATFSHAWSLCVEEHFYLVFPLLAWLLAKRSSVAGFAALCAAIVLGGIALRSAIWLHFDALQPARAWFVEDIYYPTWNRLDGLLAGVALAVWKTYRPGAWARLAVHANLMSVIGLATMAMAFWLFRDRTGLLGNSIGWPVLSLGLALLVFAGAQAGSWIGRRALPGARWLAMVSFSLYLVHKPIFGLVYAHAGDALEGRGYAAFAVYGIASLLAAAVLHYLVERPGLRLRERILARPRSVSLPSAIESTTS
ncbi:peptidoglycan/LPS O-acetylase OafA/YrhL [Pseudoxanthomonas sacheonensis]|uniref:Peptidoglycan/LPS O-acetylase OafA/YrhL n=1 Tax=Pseudoxanthomonas sacheonensis TaxID=443615 RepID=A0ABU1RSU3_9GAMM|nr:peptidoglycan/LPS O-acetylase OafA/YrhL [Pseudoxanthomonas sacheonensis]